MRELINTIAHIGYQVSDLTRSLAFYEPLGFQRQQRFSKPSPQGTIEVAFLEMAGAVLELYLCFIRPFLWTWSLCAAPMLMKTVTSRPMKR